MLNTLEIKDLKALDANAKLSSKRQKALQYYLDKGLPTSRLEDWKYTNLNKHLGKFEWQTVSCVEQNAKNHQDQQIQNIPNSYRLVIKNGRFIPELSEIAELSGKLAIMSLKDSIQKKTPKVMQWLEHESSNDSVAALNAALYSDGLYIQVSKNTVLTKNLHIVYLHENSNVNTHTFANYRNLIELGSGSKITVIEDVQVQGDGTGWVNTLSNINLAKDSELQHFVLQREQVNCVHTSDINIKQYAHSKFESFNLALGNMLARCKITTELLEDSASCSCNGAYILDKKQHSDQKILVKHLADNTKSTVFYRGIADDKAHAVFNTKAIVAEKIHKIIARQSNKNILLSNLAEIDTKPELEIYSDDILECSHGATIGKLDEDSLFYLQARGIEIVEARKLLMKAFIEIALSKITDKELFQYMEKLVFAKSVL
ncbi:MAG: Fe-S cluster assembly protein SufD [Thiotrichales bacterium]|nr:MAG: Fe-S cluster assembly protein SufD [Thiotrichales bacterium]